MANFRSGSRNINNKIQIPRWVVIVLPVFLILLGVYAVYNTFAFSPISTSYDNISDYPSRVYVYCVNQTECYNGPLLTTTQTAAFVRKSQDSNCVSGFQYARELSSVNTVWNCVLVAGD